MYFSILAVCAVRTLTLGIRLPFSLSLREMSVQIPPGLKVPPLTRLTKKRLYIPKVDVSENPFCQERQLTDAVAKIQCKPQMVVDVEVALAKKELKSDLPTSVFAPPKEVMSRQRNKLFGTVEGAADETALPAD